MKAHEEAHEHSSNNRLEISSSSICGCFHCCKSFEAKKVTNWIKERLGGETAMCPLCNIDSVIGDASGYPVTDEEFLHVMNGHWFSANKEKS